MNAAAKQVLNDWNSGKLRYHTTPPVETDETLCSAAMVSEFSKEFDLEALDGELSALVDGLDETMDTQSIVYDASKSIQSDEEMELDDGGNDGKFVVTGSKEKKNDKGEGLKVDLMPTSLDISGNVQLNRAIKSAVKKNKKRQSKIAKKTDAALGELNMDLMSVDQTQDYDFAVLDN